MLNTGISGQSSPPVPDLSKKKRKERERKKNSSPIEAAAGSEASTGAGSCAGSRWWLSTLPDSPTEVAASLRCGGSRIPGMDRSRRNYRSRPRSPDGGGREDLDRLKQPRLELEEETAGKEEGMHQRGGLELEEEGEHKREEGGDREQRHRDSGRRSDDFREQKRRDTEWKDRKWEEDEQDREQRRRDRERRDHQREEEDRELRLRDMERKGCQLEGDDRRRDRERRDHRREDRERRQDMEQKGCQLEGDDRRRDKERRDRPQEEDDRERRQDMEQKGCQLECDNSNSNQICRSLVLHNVFDSIVKEEEEFYLEIKEDVHTKCCINGAVLDNIHIIRSTGDLCLRFDSERSLKEAKKIFDGSLYGGRRITCSYMDNKRYTRRYGL
uniref:RRM domain-containing protein n=1 Tax=Leersia perrieri TaxID=77586 RepID=A0A0D9VGX4_9ORYZ